MDQIENRTILREIREEIRRVAESELAGIREFLKTFPSPMEAAFRNAPWDDEPETEEEIRLVEEAIEWLRHNEGIPHEEVVRSLGIK